MLGSVGEKVWIAKTFSCDNGKNIYIGSNFTGNFNLTILDICEVYIGDNVMIGPGTLITTVGHPLSPMGRRKHLGIAKPIHIGNDVWIGGNVTILPSVTIGNNVVVAAGAVVTKDIPDTAEEIAKLQTEISNIPPSNFRRIAVDDVTPESLVNLLEENGTLLMISDEAGMLGNFSGRYSNNVPNIDLLLKCWNGETFISDRITRESVILYKPYVSICLACQPYIWDSMIGNMAFRGSGFLARLVYCFPKDLRGTRKYNTEPIPDELSERYQKLIYALLNYKFQRFELHQADEKLLFLDEKAKDEYVFLHDQFVEKQLVTDMAFCADWGGKYHGLILRLCGIIHCIKCALNGCDPVEVRVDLDTFCNAIEIGEYFREQAIYAYSLGDTDFATVKAERVLAKIRSKRITKIRQNDLHHLCRCTLFKNAQDFNETIDMLEEYGYLRRFTSKGTNNKTVTDIEVNPHVFS